MEHFIKRCFLFFLFIALLVNLGCSSLLFYPKIGHIDNPLLDNYAPIDIFFKTSDGLILHGWFFKAVKPHYGTILVLHGNAENISTHVNSVLWLVNEGFNIFIFDYRGYGKSEGKPTLRGVHIDANAALDTLITNLVSSEDNIAVLGQSIGGEIAVYLVATSIFKHRVKALILDSTFSSYRVIAREKLGGIFLTRPFQYPLSFLFNDYFSPVKWIKSVSPIPILFIHGRYDNIIPYHHSLMLFDQAFDSKDLIISSVPGHISSFTDENIRKNITSYLVEAFRLDFHN